MSESTAIYYITNDYGESVQVDSGAYDAWLSNPYDGFSEGLGIAPGGYEKISVSNEKGEDYAGNFQTVVTGTQVYNQSGSDTIFATGAVNAPVTDPVANQNEVRLQTGDILVSNSFPTVVDTGEKTVLTIPGSRAADPAFDPIAAAREASINENTFATRAEVITNIVDAYQEIIRDALNAKPEIISGLVAAEIAFQSGLSRDQPVGPGITPRGADFDVVLSVSDYYNQIVELANAADIQLPAAVKFFETGAPNPLDFGFDVNTGAFASNEDAELYGQARVSQLERLTNLGIDTVVKGYELQQAILTQNIDTFTSRNADGSVTVNPITRQDLLEVIGQDPQILAAVGRQLELSGGSVSQADLRVDTLVPLAGEIATNEFNRVMNSQPQSADSPLGNNLNNQTITTIPAAELTTVLIGDDIQIADIQRELATIEGQLASAPIPQIPELTTAQEFNRVLNTPDNIRAAVSTTLSDYFGVENPTGQAAIERAVQLAFNQIPGVSDINRVVGTIRTVSDAATSLTSDQLSAQEAIRATLTVIALANPAVGVLLRGLDLVGAFGGPTLTDRITTLTDAATQALGQSTPPGGTGGGGGTVGDEDTTVDDATAQAGSGQSDFVETNTGLLVTPEDLFVETSPGSFVLAEEVENQVESTLPEPVDPGAAGIYPNGLPYDDDGNLNPGWAINPETGDPYFKGYDYIDPLTAASAAASLAAARQAATLASARSQAAQQAQRKQANDGDWRVKLRLAPGAEYLYKDPGLNSTGILWPLNVTDGVIFPYMPVINTSYHANYNSYDLTHSNYRGYFYQNSYVGEVNITAVFTAQDTKEAEYLLAVIHFFRSVTKMFYGQDTPGRGSPPPLVYLQGLGEYQFNLHPCLVSQFTYNLPNDVDYIRARSPNLVGTNLQIKRDRKINPTNPFSAAIERLNSIGQPKGGINIPPAPPTLGTNSPTYVPTKIEMQLTLLPTQTRQQVSQEFSLQKFANGNLLKGGYW